MLEELKGIAAKRRVKAEKLPAWVELVKYIEQNVNPDYYFRFRDKDGRCRDVGDAIKGIRGLSAADVEQYIRMSYTAHCSDEDPTVEDIGKSMLEHVVNRSRSPVKIDGTGVPRGDLFSNMTLKKDLILDNFQMDDEGDYHILSGLKVKACVTIANSRIGGLLTDSEYDLCGTAIVANCAINNFCIGEFGQSGNIILSNSTFGTGSSISACDRGSYQICVIGCTQLICDKPRIYKKVGFEYVGSKQISEEAELKIQMLGRQMQGKDGLQIYELGKQIVQILEGEKDA